MTPLSESPDARAKRELDSEDCPIDGLEKKAGLPFCRDCYSALPPGLRNRLYHTFSDGFLDHYGEAQEFLRQKGGSVTA